MAREIAWSNIAWRDLEEAANYIAKDSPYYAASFVQEVKDAACSLAHLAERGRVVPEFGDLSVRELFVRSYRMIYQVTKQSIYIVGFIHGARDLYTLWKRQSRIN